MKKLLLSILIIVACANVFAQAPDTLWTQTYGGSGTDLIRDVKQTTDGGYIMAGKLALSDWWLIKTDAQGDTQWTSTPVDGDAYSVIQTPDGGYAAAGFGSVGFGNSDFELVRFDSLGNIMWSGGFGGVEAEWATELLQTNSGDLVLAGGTGSFGTIGNGYNFWLIKTDSLGDSLWTRTFGGAVDDHCVHVHETADNGLLLVGYTSSYGSGGYDIWVIRTDSLGDSLWTRTLGGSDLDVAGDAIKMPDGGFLVVGSTQSFGAGLPNANIMIVRLDSNGDSLWSRIYGGPLPEWCIGIAERGEDEYILSGSTESLGQGQGDAFVMGINSSGDSLWSATLGGTNSDIFNSRAFLTGANSFVVAGETGSFGAGNRDGWMAKFEFPYPPTSLPFIDNFDSPELGSCWYWIREDTSRWSLTERHGYIRIVSDGEIHWDRQASNMLTRSFPDVDFVVETKVEMTPEPCTGAGITIYQSDTEFLDILKLNEGVRSHNEINDASQFVDLSQFWNPCFLRIEKRGNIYRTYAGPDSLTWILLNTWQHDLSLSGRIKVNIGSFDCDHVVHIPADFDYFRVDPLPGTEMCGNVSGVWDSTGSPYYVTCDVTVPSGQTLEIQPGVEVLFTGHYKFNVFGNLQAIGTEEDSIVFTRAFPTEESRWGGLRFNSPTDSCNLHYCRIEWVHGTGAYPENGGAGLFVASTNSFRMTNSTISNCLADDGGSGIYVRAGSPVFESCDIRNNTAVNGGGGAFCHPGSTPEFILCNFYDNTSVSDCGGGLAFFNSHGSLNRCLFVRNSATSGLGCGGAIECWDSSPTIMNCTIVDNTGVTGGGIYCFNSSPLVKNTIVWNNSPNSIQACPGSNISYSDIQGGYAGTGNIDTDPLFVDVLNDDYRLQPGSPCIDTGDPNSPLDSDGSIVDMGAFPYSGPRLRVTSPNGGENWTLLDSAVVEWIGTGFEGTVVIELNHDFPSGAWDTLAFNVPNDSTETVFVEEPISNRCRVRVSSLEAEFADISDADFSIVPSTGYLALIRQAQPNTALLSWNAGTMECPNAIQETFRMKNFGNSSINVFRPEEPASNEFSRVSACPSSFTLAPGQMSTCDLTLSFTPDYDGNYLDSMRIRTNASNGVNGELWTPLTGSQVTTPAAPEVTISVQADDAILRWPSIIESVGHCPISSTGYLVFYSPTQAGPFYYHGFTTDTSYIHTRVVHYNYGMFYRVYATIEPLMTLSELPDFNASQLMTESEILGLLQQRGIEVKRVGE